MADFQHPRNGSNTIMPQCMSGYANKEYLYGVHITKDAGAIAYRWHEPTDTYETIDLTTVPASNPNHLELPLIAPDDDHYALAVGVSWNDRMYIVGNHHEISDSPVPTTPHFIRCDNVEDFTNPASWSIAGTQHWASADTMFTGTYDTTHPGTTLCYHILDRLSDGTLLHFMSQSEVTGNARGRDWLGWKLVPVTGWESLVPGAGGHFAVTRPTGPIGSTADRAYMHGVLVQSNAVTIGQDRIHIWGIWRTKNTDPIDSQKRPYYMYSDDEGATWKAADGTVMEMPIYWDNTGENFTAAEIPFPYAYSVSVRAGIFIDPRTNYPQIVTGIEDQSNFVRCAWTGSEWEVTGYPVALQGQIREFLIKDELWVRHVGGSRVRLRNQKTAAIVNIGNLVANDGASITPDPVWLRDRGVFACNVGIGDTPEVFTFGGGARARR